MAEWLADNSLRLTLLSVLAVYAVPVIGPVIV